MSCLPALFPGRAAAPVAPEPPLRFATLADFAVERIIGIGGFGLVWYTRRPGAGETARGEARRGKGGKASEDGRGKLTGRGNGARCTQRGRGALLTERPPPLCACVRACVRAFTRVRHSSAKNTLTGMSVAIKKALKPFSTAIHCKRTYRELALLKHMHHENVRSFEAAHATHRLVEG